MDGIASHRHPEPPARDLKPHTVSDPAFEVAHLFPDASTGALRNSRIGRNGRTEPRTVVTVSQPFPPRSLQKSCFHGDSPRVEHTHEMALIHKEGIDSTAQQTERLVELARAAHGSADAPAKAAGGVEDIELRETGIGHDQVPVGHPHDITHVQQIPPPRGPAVRSTTSGTESTVHPMPAPHVGVASSTITTPALSPTAIVPGEPARASHPSAVKSDKTMAVPHTP